MRNRTHAGLLILGLAAGLTGCEGASSRSPTAPSTPQLQQTPRPTGSGPDTYNISISGVVYDTAHRLLGGARVEVMEGAVGDWCHYPQPAPVCVVAAFTDESGRFTFSGPFRSVTRLQASREGYLSATLTVDSTTSNSAIEFRLEPSAP
jgi:Carboxypeptidase regulatory-like domain